MTRLKLIAVFTLFFILSSFVFAHHPGDDTGLNDGNYTAPEKEDIDPEILAENPDAPIGLLRMMQFNKEQTSDFALKVSFVIAFLTIASSQIVAIINQTAAHVVILLLVSVFFLILVGSFWKETDTPFFLEKPWDIIFMVIMFIGIVLIFLNAITYNGQSWLSIGWSGIANINNSEFVSSVILILVVVAFMWFVTRSPKSSK